MPLFVYKDNAPPRVFRPNAGLEPGISWMLAIAACNTDARVLILDEPTVGLDSTGIQKVMDLVTAVLAQGKAVIIVTHDEEVASLAHRILVIRDGLVVEERVAPRLGPQLS